MLRKLFEVFFDKIRKREKLICGGEALCEVVDRWGRVLTRIWYTRPDADMILEYVYTMQSCLTDETDIQKLIRSKEKQREFHKSIYLKNTLPFAEKIFVRSEGYNDETGTSLSDKPPALQIEYIEKYYANHLAQMVAFAFNQDHAVKKKN